MDDKLLFKLALAFSLIGLVGLYFVSDFSDDPIYDFEDGDYVILNGKVKNLDIRDVLLFDLITDDEIFKVKATKGNVDVKNGMNVEVEGEIVKTGSMLILEAKIIRIL